MLIAIIVLTILALLFGLMLGYSSIRFHVEGDPIVDRLDALLPQTQCGQCGYPGCTPYAEAVAAEEAEINLCPPGGESTMSAIAEMLGRDPLPMGESGGEVTGPITAHIREQECIGCTLCIQACPVDAILGAAKHMHTVISDECTGCQLCLPPCPVECIDMTPVKIDTGNWCWPFPKPTGELPAGNPSMVGS
ncbi:MAG: electron transport complex subunit RsxB [Sedimenticola sp.]